jgi:hypothetical protein
MRSIFSPFRVFVAAVGVLPGLWAVLFAIEKTGPNSVVTQEQKTESPKFWSSEPAFVGDRQVHLVVPILLNENRALEDELNVGVPLDLSELALSLNELPHLPKATTPSSSTCESIVPASSSNATPGSTTDSKIANEVSSPANPLRSSRKGSDTPKEIARKQEPKEQSHESNSSTQAPDLKIEPTDEEFKKEPSPDVGSKAGEEPKPIQIGSPVPNEETPPTTRQSTNPSAPAPFSDAASPDSLGLGSSRDGTKDEVSPLKLMDSNNIEELPGALEIETIEPAEASKKPVIRKIEIEPISQEEQEAPSLSRLAPNENSSQAREEDKAALEATGPKASTKTFVGKPSRGSLNDSSRSSVADFEKSLRMERVEKCLAYYLTHLETTVERSPWSVMHAMLPFGVEGEILVGNRRTNAIQWLSNNGTCRGQKLFTPTSNFFRPNVGGGVQGHEGQFLAMLAQSQVAAEYPMVIGQRRYTVTDLIRYEMATCREQTELTFKLIGLSYYVDTSQVWTTDRRSRWNIEKLVKEELAQPINGAACGGVHRLMGLTFAVRQRQAEERPIDGQFARADKYIKDFVEYTWKLQNPDGSFSTNWFESRGNEPNQERKVQTTGHILEWLAFTLPDSELQSARFVKSIDFLLTQIYDQRSHKWPIGPRGHAIRALALFEQRTNGVQPGQRRQSLAEQINAFRFNR